MDQIIYYFFSYTERIFSASALVLALELLYPRSICSMTSRIRGAVFWLSYILITSTGTVIGLNLMSKLGIKPLFVINLSKLNEIVESKFLVSLLASWIVLQVSEFFYYWFHRAQHSNPVLWKFHEVHHSIREMNAFNSNHHFTEELLRIPFIILPMSVLVTFSQPEVTVLWAFLLSIHGVYEHSSTKLNWGWFRYLLPDNCYHRIHHSVESRHYNKNFGSGSAIWDIVFGTVHHPEKKEWPDVGLLNQDEPHTLQDFLFRPFFRKKKGDKLPQV